ncbi:hypothetical protein SB57_09995, partial [Lactobacillus delbrueckii subsp. bulgaricus]
SRARTFKMTRSTTWPSTTTGPTGGGFYPEYSLDKIEFSLDKDYVQMFSEYLTQGEVKVDTKKYYRFY